MSLCNVFFSVKSRSHHGAVVLRCVTFATLDPVVTQLHAGLLLYRLRHAYTESHI